MHLLVIGGTGACGRVFIPEALEAGHRLTLYARNPTKFSDEIRTHANVHIVKGEFTDVKAMKEALQLGAEVLVSFAGPSVPSKGMVITEFYERLYSLLPDSSIRRCLILSTASYKVPEDRGKLLWWLGVWMIRLFCGSAYLEINGLSQATASLPANIEWTLYRVPVLTNAEAKPTRASFLGDGTDRLFVSRKSIAVWILQELEERKWIGKAPSLSNPGWV